jgi:hypothetical protein
MFRDTTTIKLMVDDVERNTVYQELSINSLDSFGLVGAVNKHIQILSEQREVALC